MEGTEGEDSLTEAEVRRGLARITIDDITGAGVLNDEEVKILAMKKGGQADPDTLLSFGDERAADKGHLDVAETIQAIEEAAIERLQQAGGIVVDDGEVRKARPEEMN